ncbi:MAG: hypothetical protein GF350_00115 [Chitinivibrionales bacterium]|nr:hypothetical protein [Chitinivibrionales bacterium]
MHQFFLILTGIVLTCTCCFAKPDGEKRPFSVPALQWLLDRKEYGRFDFFINDYIQQHPDTAVLHILKSDRFFAEALEHPVQKVTATQTADPTGGIPRKYAPYIYQSRNTITRKQVFFYNDSLTTRAFNSIDTAIALVPDSSELYGKKCSMASQALRPGILASCVTDYIRRFGCDTIITKTVYDLLGNKKAGNLDSTSLAFLKKAVLPCPSDNAFDKGNAEKHIAEWFISRGKPDSAFSLLNSALESDPSDASLLNAGFKVACVNGSFAQACDFALNRYEQTGALFDLERAALAALACDTVRARQIHARLETMPGYDPEKSLTREFFSSSSSVNPVFQGDLLYLNFPAIQVRYNRTGDIIEHHFSKAGVFYALSQYDSAGYYNLNLMRRIKSEHELSFRTLYNLAAEQYAMRQYALSHQRFLELYRYYHDKRDASVHYALAVTYEAIGDLGNARYHYEFVHKLAQSDTPVENELKSLAAYSLSHLGEKKKIMLKEEMRPE